MSLKFEISGKPIPQKQTRFARGRAYDPSAKDKKRIQDQLRKAMGDLAPLARPVHVTIMFYFSPPKSLSTRQKKRLIENQWHVKKPDIDNLAYLVTNALKGIVIRDDSQIVTLALTKGYGEHDHTFIYVREEP